MGTDVTKSEHPTVYISSLQRLVDHWINEAQRGRSSDDAYRRATAYGMEFCASQLQGLIDL